jgi:hypothetical protein
VNRQARLYNLLATLISGLTVVVCLGMTAIFVDPSVFFNPFKPVVLEDVPPVLTAITPAATSTAGSTVRAPVAVETNSPTVPPSPTFPDGGTGAVTFTPFPSPVGPTETTPPTEIPTLTPTLRPPTPTATVASYPIPPTQIPPTEPPATSAYP